MVDYKRLRFIRTMLCITFFVLLLGGCSNLFNPPKDSESPDVATTGTLNIKNSSSYDLAYVWWISSDNTKYFFSPDTVYDKALSKNVGGIRKQSTATLEVKPGKNSIYFYLIDKGGELYTAEMVTVVAGGTTTFVFTNDSYVVDAE